MAIAPKVQGPVSLVRPLNGLLAAAAVVAGLMLVDPNRQIPPQILLGGPLAAFLLTGFGNVLNDLRDVEVDRIAHPERPLASGRVSRRMATNLAAGLLSAGLASSLLAGALTFLFACAVVGLLVLYEWRLKRGGLPGNVVVAALTASTFLFGAVASPSLASREWALWAAVMAFLVNLGREVVKDTLDLDGDRGARRTFPMLVGPRSAGWLACACAIVGAVASMPLLFASWPSFHACGPRTWFVAGLLVADAVVIAGGLAAPRWPQHAQWALKAGMALALATFLSLAWRVPACHAPFLSI